MGRGINIDEIIIFLYFLLRATQPTSHCVSLSVGRSVCHTLLFMHFLAWVGKFVFEHAPAQINTAPVQIITAPAQLLTAPAQPPATEVVVYTALFFLNVRSCEAHRAMCRIYET